MKFFHRMASARLRGNRFTTMIDEGDCLTKKEDIINHITSFFTSLYSREDWTRPTVDNMRFASIRAEEAS